MEAKIEWTQSGQRGPFSDSFYEATVIFPEIVRDEEAFDYISRTYFGGQLRRGDHMNHPFEPRLEGWMRSTDYLQVWFKARRLYCD